MKLFSSSFPWFSTYCLIVSSSTAPTVPQNSLAPTYAVPSTAVSILEIHPEADEKTSLSGIAQSGWVTSLLGMTTTDGHGLCLCFPSRFLAPLLHIPVGAVPVAGLLHPLVALYTCILLSIQRGTWYHIPYGFLFYIIAPCFRLLSLPLYHFLQ